MTDFHAIGTTEDCRKLAEAAGPGFVQQGLLQARDKSWKVLHEIRKQVKEGMTERQGYHLALEIFHGFGVDKHWHKPYLRFGPGTALTFHDSLQPDYRLEHGDPFYIDLGPVWRDSKTGIEYEGDVGDTFVLGENVAAEIINADARKLFQLATDFWRREQATGKMVYAFLATEARALNYQLKPDVDGHRLSDYPHNKYSKERLARTAFHPSPGYWVLEVQILSPQGTTGAFYEDLLIPMSAELPHADTTYATTDLPT